MPPYCPKDFDRIWKSFDVRTLASGITLGHPTVRSSLSSLGKAATGSQTESKGIFQSAVSAFKLAGGRIRAMSARHGLRGPHQSRSPRREMPRR